MIWVLVEFSGLVFQKPSSFFLKPISIAHLKLIALLIIKNCARAGNVDHIEMNKTSNLSTNYTTNHLKFNHRVYNKVQGAIKKQ